MLKKKNVFRLILILIPLIFLAALEIILRVTNYGTNLSIVAETEMNGKKYYTMNQLVGERYFNEDRLYYRKGSHDFFEVDKNPNTIRVFCFGESSTAGFPYEYNAIPTEFFRDRLIDALPNKNIEVINTAIAATNSYTVSEFVKELSHYKPDLFIIYMGQNEFYGAFGVGSTISIGKSRWLIKTYLWLQQFKTFILLKNIISSISNYFKPSENNQEKILMEQMVKNNSIRYNSSDYKTARNSFEENYKEIIETAKKNNIPIIISTVVTNEKDLPPFVSIYSSDSAKQKCKDYYVKGIKFKNSRDYIAALKSFQKGSALDSEPANIHYQMGICYDSLKSYEKARSEFIKALNLDGLRFRAPSEFNKIIKKLSYRFNVPLADVSKAFRENSPHGLIGKELLIDHVHPNIKGYFLLAKVWFETLKKNGLLGLSPVLSESDTLLWKQANVTPLDSIIGELKILKLKTRPPFSKSENEFTFKPTNPIEEIAFNYLSGNDMSWGMAHIMAAKEYLSRNDLQHAVNEYNAILISDETNTNVLSIVGDIYYQMKMYPEANSSYSKALSLSDNQFLKYRLGLTNLYLQKPEKAVQYFRSCLDDNDFSQQKFTIPEVEKIRYNLAKAYFLLSEKEKALSELSIILKNDPQNKNALDLLNEIKN